MKATHTTFGNAALLGAIAALLVHWTGSAAAGPANSESNKRPFTTEFHIGDCTFVNDDTGSSSNPYWIPLIPGYQTTFEDGEGGENVITVCGAADCPDTTGTEVVDGVTTRVIEERESEDGELVEVSRNFFARCEENGSVFYFGEDVDIYTDEGIVHSGEWRAGVNGAEAGVIMPGHFLLGSRYYQELAPGAALDRAENDAMGLAVEVPYDGGTLFEDCVRVFETSDLAGGDRSEKKYCPGVGLVFDDGQELVDKNF